MSRFVRAVVLSCALVLPLSAQQPVAAPPLGQPLGIGPEIVAGTLPNGLHYYIRKNAEPAKRAELRLAVNAGGILEDDDQQGYAHFVEHTAFNGTTHFKKNDLMKYLESIGVKFGADLNASTTFDQTVYQLSIPTDTGKFLETGFVILADWAHGQTFDSTEVVNERGVVVEEWRGGLGAGERMRRQFVPIILKGSKYAERNVIGSEASITRAQPSVLRRFYDDWYRPDLMAVVAVGDFDVATVESLIRKNFSGIPMPANPRPRPSVTVPSNVTPLVAIASDPEANGSSFLIGYKRPRKIVSTVGDYRTQIAERLYFAMVNDRLDELRQKPDAPYLFASANMSSFFARDVSALTFSGAVKDGGIERGAEAVLTEARRVDQFGFLPAELQRAKDNMLRSYERMYAERARTNSAVHVGELVRNFLEQEDIPGTQAEYDMTRAFLPGISLDEVNRIARDWITDDNRIAVVMVPQKPGVPIPTEAQMLAVFDRVARAPVAAYAETMRDDPLIDHAPIPGKVVGTRMIDGVGVTEWRLSNGARVLVKPTDFKADEVLFSAYSPGGTSLVRDADYMSASTATAIMRVSGVGKFSAIDLPKKLAGKVARVTPTISSTTEGLSGSASPKDLETLFQLAYLEFTAPRLDTAAWLAMKGQMEAQVANRGANPQLVWIDSANAALSQHHFRSRPPSAATLAEIDPNRALEIYKDRFSNAGDFTFVFVGNVTPDSLKPLVEKYLASLPSTRRVEKGKDVGDAPPRGVVDKVVRKGTAPQSLTVMFFTGRFDYTVQNRVELNALVSLAQSRLIETLREEMGGTYSPILQVVSMTKSPRSEYEIVVQYSSSPDNADKLSARLFRMIDSLRNFEPSAADLAKVKETSIRSREVNLKTNGYWMSSISTRDQTGEDLAGMLAPYDAILSSLTPKQIQNAARLYLDPTRYVKVVLLPEK